LTPYEIIVVAGIIQKNEKYLIAQRKKDLNGGGFWEFPGGKVEPGENHSQALVRELKEELDIEAELGDFFGENIVQFGEKKYHLYAYHIKKYSGEPFGIRTPTVSDERRSPPANERRSAQVLAELAGVELV
jgi:mutator protein MutT